MELIFEKKEQRFSDDDIYLNEDRYEKPKEIFKFFSSLIENNLKLKIEKSIPKSSQNIIELLDVGCATGELIYYLKKKFDQFKFTGIDVSSEMISKAGLKMPDVKFLCQDILSEIYSSQKKYDLVISTGVISIFDNFQIPIRNLLSCLKKGGTLYLETAFNLEPIDVILRYRRANQPQLGWESGWNIISMKTCENILNSTEYSLSWKWHDFKMPFAIPKTNDPMRTWTIKTEENNYQLINGAEQLVNLRVLEVHLDR